jgi:hypothetical protein
MDLQYVTPYPDRAGRAQPRRRPSPSNSPVVFRPHTRTRGHGDAAACYRTSHRPHVLT